MDAVAGRTQLVGEGADAGRDALGVVEEQNLGHGDLQGSRDIVDRGLCSGQCRWRR